MKLKELTNAPRNGNFRYHVRAAAEMLLDDLEGEAWEATHAILCLGLSASVSKYDQAIDNAVDKIIACGMDEKIVSF